MSKIHKFFLISSACMLVACSDYKYQDDNVVEEIVEESIDAETGLDIDLTPSDPEKGFSPKSISPFQKEDETKK